MARGVRMVRWCMRGRKALSALGSCKSAKGCTLNDLQGVLKWNAVTCNKLAELSGHVLLFPAATFRIFS